MRLDKGLFTHESIWLSLLKGGAKRKHRDLLAMIVRNHINQHYPIDHHLRSSKESRAIVSQLKKSGLSPCSPVFNGDERKQLLNALLGLKVEYLNAESARVLQFDNLSERYEKHQNIHYARYRQTDLLKIPVVNRLLNDINFASVPLQYLGCIPTLSSVNCWWSFPGKKTAGAQNFHQDRGDFLSLNMFCYLTDVDKSSGPHVYCEHTHTYALLQRYALSLSPALQSLFWEWWETHRKADGVTELFFKPTVITGQAGTSFFEDTCGLHKGMAPTQRKRLCFELVWTAIPQFNHRLVPVNNRQPYDAKEVKRINCLAYRY